ncbi:ABC transporter permease [Actinomyces israelii]|uniref:ABC transporter permease n=1 Tax=Actinomyces israelii TaxID=1659 RepID=A0ABT4I7T9_9ACTO|nr:ABC transporter permease [Actinomyces israelii]MCZ0857799.1 ABC transporter permease [Actinomyces israelii]WKR23055.1 Macrolide export ATP-binding/permease protein MacB [Actinomyces israelii]
MSSTTTRPKRSHLRPADILRLAGTGLRARPMRAFLSALGIAIGIAAMIAVVGVSTSSRAQLTAQLESLGTNMLTLTPGSDLTGTEVKFPTDAVGRVNKIDGVQQSSSTSLVKASVYRNSLSDKAATGGISALVAEPGLLDVVAGEVDKGAWLNPATSSYPSTVLGASAARRLGVVEPGTQVWLGGTSFTVVGILKPSVLAPELDNAALIGAPVAERLFGYAGNPTTIYERSADKAVERVRELLGPTISPQAPGAVKISRPSDALAAKNAADQAFTSLLTGVGSIALIVGGIGVANTMIISVLERRREIGLRRALGAMRSHILIQFLAEALLLAGLGGALGCVIGVGVTAGVAAANGWPFSLPALIILAGLGVTVIIGAVAGLYPAVRAARTPPTAALNAQ